LLLLFADISLLMMARYGAPLLMPLPRCYTNDTERPTPPHHVDVCFNGCFTLLMLILPCAAEMSCYAAYAALVLRQNVNVNVRL